ncbi:MAG: DUF1190 domain-containing protein [Gemmatimonadetes bacterium]|nr:DUF1190 domain-containing protein [Gemmatimonadota bacterium]
MKKSASIQLLFVNTLVLGAVACDDAPTSVDPCTTRTFNPEACEVAVQNHGYHYHGAWIPLMYLNPYPFYFGRYNSYVARGGTVYSAPLSAYARTYRSLDARAAAYAAVATPRGTLLSPTRMRAMTARPASIASARRGATVGRGGFGSIGAGRTSAGS